MRQPWLRRSGDISPLLFAPSLDSFDGHRQRGCRARQIPCADGCRGVAWLNTRRTANPTGFWLATSAILALIIGGYAGWQWYEHLPEPYYLQVSVNRPGPTAFEANALPDTINVQFSGSAARLGAIGKNVTSGITITPQLRGSWGWISDSELVFMPKNDWPIGQDYTIKLDRELFPSHVLLRDYTYPFRSPDFDASIQDEEFYEDPTDPKIKQVVATVRFTHPVDKADFEKRISMRMRVEPVKNFDSSDAKSFGFKVTYDAFAGKAFIHSDSFGIPNDEGEMLLSIAAGVRSSQGGPGTDFPLERTVNIPGIESYFRIRASAPMKSPTIATRWSASALLRRRRRCARPIWPKTLRCSFCQKTSPLSATKSWLRTTSGPTRSKQFQQ